MTILRGGVRLRPSSDDGGGESDERDELSAALMIFVLISLTTWVDVSSKRWRLSEDYLYRQWTLRKFNSPFP